MKIKHIICAFLGSSLFYTSAYAVSDSLTAVSDSRVKDPYTGLVYGAVSSELMTSSSANVVMNGAVEIRTSDTVSVRVREDVIDTIVQTGSGSAECTIELDILSCSSIELKAKLSETKTATLWSASDLSGELIISVITKNGKVQTTVNGEPVGEINAEGRPAAPELIVSKAELAVTAVSYEPIKGETVKIINGTEECRGKLPDADFVTVRVENPEYKNDYLIGAYKSGFLQQCRILTKENMKTVREVSIPITSADTLKVFAWDGVGFMTPVLPPIELIR